MAKRKRLTPAQPGFLEAGHAPEARPGAPGPAPIAQVAGDTAARAALDDLAGQVEAAREQGLILELLPIEAIDEGYLVRDRMEQDEDEMGALMDSLRARGQQTPIEVIRLPDAAGGKAYGLISGWRRLVAFRRLYEAEDDRRFAHIRATVIAPETAQDAYVAMVEENEIRVNLSLYERARIALRAMHEGVYPTPRSALQNLFASTTRSKRSKIGTFISVVEALDPVLKFPAAIPEKLGLALARELVRDPGFGERLRARLREAPAETAGAELRVLSEAVATAQPPRTPAPPGDSPAPAPAAGPSPAPSRPRIRTPGDIPRTDERISVAAASGVHLRFTPGEGRIELTGEGVDVTLFEALQDWLRRR